MRTQEKILSYFQHSYQQGRLGTSYLFIGNPDNLLLDVIKLLSCTSNGFFCDVCWDCKRINQGTHPDVYFIQPEAFTIKIDAVRQGIRFLSLKSFCLPRKYLIIKEAHLLSPAAANAFLKTLEEPPRQSFIGICTTQIDDVLPTIISRCRKIFLPFQEHETESGVRVELIDFLKGKDVKFKDRQRFSLFLWALIICLRQTLLWQFDRKNNQLSKTEACEIILRHLGPNQIRALLEDVLRMYAAHKTVNMNLAVQLIRMKLAAAA